MPDLGGGVRGRRSGDPGESDGDEPFRRREKGTFGSTACALLFGFFCPLACLASGVDGYSATRAVFFFFSGGGGDLDADFEGDFALVVPALPGLRDAAGVSFFGLSAPLPAFVSFLSSFLPLPTFFLSSIFFLVGDFFSGESPPGFGFLSGLGFLSALEGFFLPAAGGSEDPFFFRFRVGFFSNFLGDLLCVFCFCSPGSAFFAFFLSLPGDLRRELRFESGLSLTGEAPTRLAFSPAGLLTDAFGAF